MVTGAKPLPSPLLLLLPRALLPLQRPLPKAATTIREAVIVRTRVPTTKAVTTGTRVVKPLLLLRRQLPRLLRPLRLLRVVLLPRPVKEVPTPMVVANNEEATQGGGLVNIRRVYAFF